MGGRAVRCEGRVMTVRGAIEPEAFVPALTHEHTMVDFIGADRVGPERYDAEEVFAAVLPHLRELADHGVRGFVDCTPAWLARDAVLLRRWSEATGLHILTNTGYYGAAGDRFVPAHAHAETADQLAARWLREWREGIVVFDGEPIRPGFIKTAVDNGPLSELDARLIRAAARAHRSSGLTINCHTTDAEPIAGIRAILAEEGVAPEAFVWVHAHMVDDAALHADCARSGMWVSFDGIPWQPPERHRDRVLAMRERGLLGRVLLSHDAGWYEVGKPGGGAYRPHTALFTDLLPLLRKAGVSEDELDGLIARNPAAAFTVRVRRTGQARAQDVS